MNTYRPIQAPVDLIDQDWQEPPPAGQKKFPLVPFDSIGFSSAPSYLIKNLLPRRGLILIYGQPKTGKSFVTADMALHVALGWPYRGRRVRAGAVVYLCLEGQAGFRNRLVAFRAAQLQEDHGAVGFHLIEVATDLVADLRALTESIRSAVPAPAVVVVDTLNRSLAGSESSDADMARYIAAANAITAALECLVILVHHSGHKDERPRGHSSLTASADVQIVVKKAASGVVTCAVEYNKDGPEGATWSSRIKPVEIGVDEDGDAVTSCIVEPIEDDDPAAAKARATTPRPAKLGRPAEALLRAFDDVGPLARTIRVMDEGPAVKAAKLKDVRAAFRRFYVTGEDDPTKVDANLRQAFKRAIAGAAAAALRTGSWSGEEWIWKA